MKPFLLESEDSEALQTLGRASVQIVHDLKNQLNGLKLYATFLRKRLEKPERAPDELETIIKLIAGLDRTAADLSLIVDYAHPVELKKRPETDLQTIVRDVAARVNSRPPTTGSLAGPVLVAAEPGEFIGEFDPVMLAQALESISVGALRMLHNGTREATMEIQLKSEATEMGSTGETESKGDGGNNGSDGVIEWPLPETFDHDPFHSFAGSNEIRLSLAARIIEAHGGSAERRNGAMCVRLPLGK
jgi:signal transduction histidine kinase